MKLNNKGFAITTILYGSLILFMLLFLSLLGMLSQYKNNLRKLIENTNGARDIVTITPYDQDNIRTISKDSEVSKGSLYTITGCSSKCVKYLANGSIATCE